MPEVFITANRARSELTDEFLVGFAEQLRAFTAQALSCDDVGGRLNSTDVEVEIKDRDPKRNIGGAKYDLKILILANDFPSRKANLEQRGSQLKEKVAAVLAPNIHGSIWIRLAPAAYVQF